MSDEQVQHLRLHRDVERRGRLVEQQHRRLQHQRPGDRHPLPLAARELVRIAVEEGRRQADVDHRLLHPLRPPVEAVDDQRLGQRGADRVPRVQRAVGVLEHHLHVAAVGLARGLAHRLAADLDPAGPGVEQEPDALQDRGLARARLADEAEALARADREADVVEDLPRLVAEAEGDRQAVDRDVAHAFTSASGRFQLSSRRSTASGARLAADVRLRGDQAARVVVPGVPRAPPPAAPRPPGPRT